MSHAPHPRPTVGEPSTCALCLFISDCLARQFTFQISDFIARNCEITFHFHFHFHYGPGFGKVLILRLRLPLAVPEIGALAGLECGNETGIRTGVRTGLGLSHTVQWR